MSKLLICDLDNTLYDWVSYFVPSIQSLIDTASHIMSCPEKTIIGDLKKVHQRYHNTEHPFALLETDAYLSWSTRIGPDARKQIDPAFHAFNSTRKQSLKLYDGVLHALEAISLAGIPIYAFSDSGFFGVLDRVKRLNIEHFFKRIYCAPRADEIPKIKSDDSRWKNENVVELLDQKRKPNPQLLKDICAQAGISPQEAIYVGDSLSKDVWMANQAGVFAVWAKYGTNVSTSLYEQLVALSHWNDEDVRREREAAVFRDSAKPDFVCEHRFDELLQVVSRESSFADQHAGYSTPAVPAPR